MDIIRKIAAWIAGLFRGKQLFTVIWKNAKTAATAAALDKLNDGDLQAAALVCVQAAAAKALKGDDAWDDAWDAFKRHAANAGKDWGRSVLETVLQNAYMAWKGLAE